MHSFNESIRWVQAIVFQGARVHDAHACGAPAVTISDRNRVEEQFFLNACEKAFRWLNSLSSEGRDEEIRQHLPVDAIREFRRSMKSNGIRNLREHEEEYLKTGGRSLEDELVDASHHEGGLKVLVEPGITILRDGDVIIGGRLSVREAILSAEKLNTALVDAQHAYTRSKYKLLRDADAADYPHMFAPNEIS